LIESKEKELEGYLKLLENKRMTVDNFKIVKMNEAK